MVASLLTISATGQPQTVYTHVIGRRAEGDAERTIVLVDNGRRALAASEDAEAARCIRCGACMVACPVFRQASGHGYRTVYPGPIGSVVTPALIGIEKAKHLPNASTFCGRCEEVCPMRIPLPKLMRHYRERAFDRGLTPPLPRLALALWAFAAKRPALYRMAFGLAARLLALAGGRRGRFRALPFAGGWTRHRDMPAPQGKTFQQRWDAAGGAR